MLPKVKNIMAMESEKIALDGNIERLKAHINSEVFNTECEEERKDKQDQLNVMEKYSSILERRINRAKQ